MDYYNQGYLLCLVRGTVTFNLILNTYNYRCAVH